MKTPVTIHHVNDRDVKMVFNGLPFQMPQHVQNDVNKHWDNLLASGRNYKRGDVFSIQSINNEDHQWHVSVAQTDYAHYLATRHDLPSVDDYPCRVLHTAVLVHTADDYLVMGRMGSQTSSPLRVQCVGGGITKDDLQADGTTFDISSNAKTELEEEIGLFADNPGHISSMSLKYLKTGGRGYLSAIFVAETPLNLLELQIHFENYNRSLEQQNETPEFSEIVYCINNPGAVELFIENYSDNIDEYVPQMMRTHAGIVL